MSLWSLQSVGEGGNGRNGQGNLKRRPLQWTEHSVLDQSVWGWGGSWRGKKRMLVDSGHDSPLSGCAGSQVP